MSTLVNSPFWGAMAGVASSSFASTVVMIFRVLGKVSRIEDKMNDIAQDVTDIKTDTNIVRWSDVARQSRRKGGRSVF